MGFCKIFYVIITGYILQIVSFCHLYARYGSLFFSVVNSWSTFLVSIWSESECFTIDKNRIIQCQDGYYDCYCYKMYGIFSISNINPCAKPIGYYLIKFHFDSLQTLFITCVFMDSHFAISVSNNFLWNIFQSDSELNRVIAVFLWFQSYNLSIRT